MKNEDLYKMMEEENFRKLMDKMNECAEIIWEIRYNLSDGDKFSAMKKLRILEKSRHEIHKAMIKMQFIKDHKINFSNSEKIGA